MGFVTRVGVSFEPELLRKFDDLIARKGYTNKLLHLQHHHASEIQSTTHIHIDEHLCLEVLVVKGKVKRIRDLADNIKAIKGVMQGELVVTGKK